MSQAEYVERMSLVVRTSGDEASLLRELVSEVRSVAPGLPPSTALTSSQYLEFSVGNTRGPAIMVFAFGVLALVLATVGLYGVMWYTVTQRGREFGVRLALGASEREVVRMVMGQGLKTTLVGVVLGMILAAAGARMLSGLLYEVGPLDPLVFALVPAVLILVGQLASYLPAKHASRASPVEVMRAE
jgi:ABC-type antimicrobial peptide transport system permease subunit